MDEFLSCLGIMMMFLGFLGLKYSINRQTSITPSRVISWALLGLLSGYIFHKAQHITNATSDPNLGLYHFATVEILIICLLIYV